MRIHEQFRSLVRKVIPNGPVARNVSVLAGGTALSQALAVIATPLLTRLYRAEDFGYLQFYLSIVMMASLAVTLRYELAILLPEDDKLAASVTAAAFAAVALMTAVFGIAAWLVEERNLLPAKAAGLHGYVWVIPVAACGAGAYQVFTYWALRQKDYDKIAGTRLTQAVGQLGTQISVGCVHAGPLGLLLGDAIGRATGSSALAKLLWSRGRKAFAGISWRAVVKAARRYQRFPLVSSWSALLNMGAYSFPPLLMADLYGARMLGWFALGDRVLGAPTLLIGRAVSQVYSVEAATFGWSDPRALQALFLRSIKRLALLGAVPFILFFIFSPSAFALVFGRSWREAGVYARILAPMHYLAFVSWPLTQTLNILEQQFWQLSWDASRMFLTCGSLWVVFHWRGSARVAIGALSATMFLSYAVHLVVCELAIRKRIREFQARKPFDGSVDADYAAVRGA
jgi:O-antigen/teichoic acid export membrane protein